MSHRMKIAALHGITDRLAAHGFVGPASAFVALFGDVM
jgi:hypothetical protein